ncbi:MAG: hypothetical protein H6925_01240 [Holosporaceae bacterium]|nr:MAG: hypothetical protein H6925_01240 [Holosporaceae bacterium]
MKSKLSCALGAILLSTTALASAPEGFYGGIGSGVSFTSVNAQIFSTNGANQGATNILKQKNLL